MGWKAESFFELPREVGGRDVADFRKTFHGPFLVGSGVHAVFRAQEAAEEIGVLDVRWRHFTADKRSIANAGRLTGELNGAYAHV